MVFDGYDLIVYGTVQSSLISETGWGLTKATAGTIGSMAFVGMMIGAIFAGRMADSWGRRRTILGCAVVFSIFTILCAFAPNAAVFGALRLLAGIGLGGLVPSANALVAELVPTKWRSTVATLMMSGVPIGGSIAALVGIQLIPAFGWESMFLVAVLALVIVVPLGLKYLPETLAPVSADKAARKAAGKASTIKEPSGFSSLLRAPYLGVSMLFALATIATLFAWYGLGTWLPNLMQLAGYNLGSALTFALALNLGAVAGSVLTAWAGTRFGPVPTAIAAAAVAAGALMVLVDRTAGHRRVPHAGPRRRRNPRHAVPDHRRRREPLSRTPAGHRAGLGAGDGPHRRRRRTPDRRPAAGRRAGRQLQLPRLRRCSRASPRSCWPPSASN